MTEARSHFSLWAMVNSPLIIGFDLRKANPEQPALLGNSGIIALNQDPAGHQAVLACQSGELQILVKTLGTGAKGVAIFNRGLGPVEATLSAAQLKMKSDAEIVVTDLWTGETRRFTGDTKFTVAPRQTLVFTAAGTRALANGLYLSARPGNVNPAVDGVAVPQHDPWIHRSIPSWMGTRGSGEHPQYGGWGGVQTGYAHFSTLVGIDDAAQERGRPVTFEVYGDGRLLARSGPICFGQAAVSLDADVRGVKLIELVARVPGRGAIAPLPVVWGQAALLR